MNSEINKIYYYLPEKIITNKDLEADFPEWDSEKIENKIGIKERHIAGETETALDLGYKAALGLINEIDKSKIDFLLFCTQSPDYFLPTSACILQEKLGLNKDIGALDYNLGCSGFVYGLALAKGLIHAEIVSNVLLVTSETYNKHIHKKDKSNRTIFGDGAAATLITKSDKEKIFKFDLGTDGNGKNNLIVKNGGIRNRKLITTEKMDNAGNIYSDEMLWLSNIHPESKPSKIPIKYLQNLYISMREILRRGINFGGDSMSDYRDINGEKGDFQNHHNVYKKKNTKCVKKGCRGVIMRKVINGRSAHFCGAHQELFN